ncbi:MAG TPA: EF-hand domain-containing protein [Kofleriaceae bacterium]|nr:EF-hand domain-containing protein [Kofleriaceae bacterium]
MKVALALCGSILVGGVGLAAAQGFGGGPDKATIMQKYDANGDGKLDDAEKAKLHADMKVKREAKKAEMLQKYDLNKDGKLDPSERAVMKNERAQEAFKKADANGDGQLSLDEFKAMKQHHGMRHGRGGKSRHRGEGARGGFGPKGGE